MVPFCNYIWIRSTILPVRTFTRSYGSVPRFVSRRKECLSLPRQTSSSIPPLATEERKRKNLLARRFLFHRALLAGLLLPFSLFTRRIFEGVSPRLVAWPDFQPSSPRSWRRVLVLPRWNILDFDADWFYQRETEKGEGRREELRLVRGLKLFWFSLERGIIY